jgi:hypothetical protein
MDYRPNSKRNVGGKMKISKTAEAYILCGLAIIAYPFVRLFQKIKGKCKKKECPDCEHFVGCESYGRVCGKYEGQ